MKVEAYRIKHKPTGLYYCPARSIKCTMSEFFVKSNLSAKGKVYLGKPSLKHIGNCIYTHIFEHKNDGKHYGSKYIDCTIDDFEIEKVE